MDDTLGPWLKYRRSTAQLRIEKSCFVKDNYIQRWKIINTEVVGPLFFEK